MQRPARFQRHRHAFPVGGSFTAGKVRYDARLLAWSLETMVAFDRARNEIDLLFGSGADSKIDEPALDLRPLIPHVMREAMRVLLEGLMENADDDEPPFASRRGLGELLKDVEVLPLMRRALKKLAHLVHEQQNATMRAAIGGRSLHQCLDQVLFGPSFARLPIDET